MDIPVYFLYKKPSAYTDTRRIDLCSKPCFPHPSKIRDFATTSSMRRF